MTQEQVRELINLFENCYKNEYQTIGNDVDYLCVRINNILYIFFKGSDSEEDWRANFAFGRKPYKDMEVSYKVHGGFLERWKEVEDTVAAQIKDDTIEKIVIAGYSHGAALAAFCHEFCWYHRKDLRAHIWGVGFESPRVYGGLKVKKELEERWAQFFVIRNGKDIVTHLPPRCFGFCHVGKVIKIGQGRNHGYIKAHTADAVKESLMDIAGWVS